MHLVPTKTYAQCEASFEYAVIDSFDLHVFYNTSSGEGVRHIYWEFGDGSIADDLNPSHEYERDGVFQVCLTVLDSNLCASTYCEFILVCNDCVWPGDANADGIVNYRDILPIGLSYDSIGPARFDTSLAWAPYIQLPWEQNQFGAVNLFPESTNFKHSDCNGDGIVNAEDTVVVLRNYNQVRTAKLPRQSAACADPNLPPLFLEFTQDSLTAGTVATVLIHLGSNQNPAENVYGIALAVNYESIFIDSGSVNLSFINSEIGIGNVISISNTNREQEKTEGGIIRIDHQSRRIAEVIGRISFVMEDNLISKTDFSDMLSFGFLDVIVVDSSGAEIPVCPKSDSVVIYQLGTGIKKPADYSFSISPNPATDIISISLPDYKSTSLRLLNILGEQLIFHDISGQKNIALAINHLPRGTYLLQLEQPQRETITRKIIIQ